VAKSRADRLVGILNGVDYTAWNPEKDKLIAVRYSANDFEREKSVQAGAAGIVRNVTRSPGSAADRNRVGGFADQKGFDLIAEKAHELMREIWCWWYWERASASMKIFSRRWRGVPGPRGREDRL